MSGNRKGTTISERPVQKGLFICIEGIHGAGKTTLITKLIHKIKQEYNLHPEYIVDQMGTSTGMKIRKILLEDDNEFIPPIAETMLIAANRALNIEKVIVPNLEQGNLVISERYNDALYAFQGYGRGLPVEYIESVTSVLSSRAQPDITILLDLEPEIALARIKDQKKHRIERETIDFHHSVRNGYLNRASKKSSRMIVIDATEPPESVFDNVWDAIRNRFDLGD